MRFNTFVGVLIVGILAVLGWGIVSCTKHPAAAPMPAPTQAVQTTPTSTPTAASAGSQPLRPLDHKVLALLNQPLPADNKNGLPGEAWQVRLYREKTQPKVGHLKISLQKDGKWDEKWEVKWKDGPHVTREVSPNRDNRFTVKYRLEGDTWVLK